MLFLAGILGSLERVKFPICSSVSPSITQIVVLTDLLRYFEIHKRKALYKSWLGLKLPFLPLYTELIFLSSFSRLSHVVHIASLFCLLTVFHQ